MNVHQPAISRHRGRAGAAFFASLDHEWRALARSMAFAEQVREWSLREPVLATWTVDGAGPCARWPCHR